MAKTYLELATEVVTAMVNRGYIKVVPERGEDWKAQNNKAIKTVGWAILEMYREVQSVPKRSTDEEHKSEKQKAKIITAK
jgi:hypothetical protein